MEKSVEHLGKLKAEVLRCYGKELWSQTDFEELSASIEQQTGSRLSVYTLRRLFGNVENNGNPAINTLSILARYVGYAGWGDFLSQTQTHQVEEKDDAQKTRKASQTWTKSLSYVVAIVVLLGVGLWFFSRQAEQTSSQEPLFGIIVQGGDTLMWKIDEASWTLTIGGRGRMRDFLLDDVTEAWLVYRDSLRSVIINEGVTSIGNNAFYHCSNIKDITLPESLASIGSGAFKECHCLRDVVVPGGVKTIRFDAFAHCYHLRSCVLLGEVTWLDRYTFARCYELKRVTLPPSLVKIGEFCFLYCRSLEEIAIPEGVTVISKYAFQGCTALRHVTLPSTLKRIDDSAFEDCDNLNLKY